MLPPKRVKDELERLVTEYEQHAANGFTCTYLRGQIAALRWVLGHFEKEEGKTYA